MKHLKNERTLVVIKPDGIQRTLVGEIVKRYERVGLKLVALKMLVPTDKHVEIHYTLDPSWLRNVGEKSIEAYLKKGLKAPSNDPVKLGKVVLESLRKFMTSGPVIAMVWEGAHAVAISRKITGGTEPLTSGVGTIRGDFVLDSYQMADTDKRAVRNLIHASGSSAEAEMEITHWFKKEEIIDYTLVQERILYDVNLGGLLK
ncbi:MAG: nucleoside-diphosphate kinase [Candidatus Taylorbacteria bacterium]|nr:nucleoside-diphosphate kinase [Candidatus Taylorbacteria bacterium]